jgi:hypothetical protein
LSWATAGDAKVRRQRRRGVMTERGEFRFVVKEGAKGPSIVAEPTSEVRA